MIRRFSVTNLNGRFSTELNFHEDLNILTGRNGSGKTTVLKLIWYLTSGNIERIANEMTFDSASVVTDDYSLSLTMTHHRGHPYFDWTWEPSKGTVTRMSGPQGVFEFAAGSASRFAAAAAAGSRAASAATAEGVQEANDLVGRFGSSLFFPTFRRIEGGFSLGDRRGSNARAIDIGPSLERFSSVLSVADHVFVSSVSTSDIVTSLTSHYAEVSEQLNERHRVLSDEISVFVSNYEIEADSKNSKSEKLDAAHSALENVKTLVKDHSDKQRELLRPFDALTSLILTIFRHKGIKMTPRLTLGEAQEAIASDKLSAGEKQMMSFLVYNAFATNTSIFIDEPEISLHVDWQRLLFPTLLAQGKTNQFIIATHSPFIYSQYSDKELVLDADRGE